MQTEWPNALLHEADSVPVLQALIDAHPDAELLLLDLHMPGARGYSALAHIRGQHPGLPTIVVSGHEEAQVARRALAHGALAYIPKSSSGEEIATAVRSLRHTGARKSDSGATTPTIHTRSPSIRNAVADAR